MSEGSRWGVLAGLCFVMFFFRLGGHMLWDIDEGMHALTSMSMLTSGDWVVPTFNGEAFFDKPPLFNWLGALSFLMLGFTEFAARLPAALLGLVGVLAVYGFGRRMFGSDAAFLSAIVLATSLEYVALSRVVVHDSALAFFVTIALLCFYRAYTVPEGRARFLVLTYLSIGLAILAKGPVGLVLVGGVAGSFMLFRRDLGFLRKMMPVRGALIVLAVAAPWYLLVSARDESFLEHFVLTQNLGNFLSSEARHAQPFYYYLPVLIVGFLPWSFYLPQAIARGLRRRRRDEPAGLFVALWFAVVLVFFSLASSKLPTYILPLFSAAALLLGSLWQELLETPDRALIRWARLAHLASVALALAAIRFLWFDVRLNPEIGPKLPGWAVPTVSSSILSGLLLSSYWLLRSRFAALFRTMSGFMLVTIVFFTLAIAPGLDPYKSSKTITLELDALLPPGEKLTFYRWYKDSGMFYTGREAELIHSQEELLEYLGEPGALCMIEVKRLDQLELADEIRRASRVLRSHGNKLILEGRGPESE